CVAACLGRPDRGGPGSRRHGGAHPCRARGRAGGDRRRFRSPHHGGWSRGHRCGPAGQRRDHQLGLRSASVIRLSRVRPSGSGWVLLVLASLPLTGIMRRAAVGTPTTAALIIALLIIATIGVIVPVFVVRRV